MFRLFGPLLLLWFCVANLWADEPKLIAGRSVDVYAAQLDDEDRVVRLRAARSLGAFGAPAGKVLRQALDHDDAAVRYLAAVHLGRIGGEPLEMSIKRLDQLARNPASLSVRMAASFALCRAGQIDEHLPLLIETLEYPERGTSCSAAELIGAIGPKAAVAIEPLETVYAKNRPGTKGGDYHIGGAAMNALRKLRPE